jgi:hypothetical protein
VELQALAGTYIDVNEVDSFMAIVSNGNSPTFKWYINGVLQTGASATSGIFVAPAGSIHNNDSVTVQVTNSDACALSTFNSIRMKVNTTNVSPVASASDIRLIPNPNSGDFIVSGTLGSTANEEANIEITDMLGQIVYRNKVMSHAGSINEHIRLDNTLANGMYMLNVKTANETKVFHFVLKQ